MFSVKFLQAVAAKSTYNFKTALLKESHKIIHRKCTYHFFKSMVFVAVIK